MTAAPGASCVFVWFQPVLTLCPSCSTSDVVLLCRWLEAWRDLRELQSAGAFAVLTKEAMLAELCRALLRGSHFSLAHSYLQVRPLCAACHGHVGHVWLCCGHSWHVLMYGSAAFRRHAMSISLTLKHRFACAAVHHGIVAVGWRDM